VFLGVYFNNPLDIYKLSPLNEWAVVNNEFESVWLQLTVAYFKVSPQTAVRVVVDVPAKNGAGHLPVTRQNTYDLSHIS